MPARDRGTAPATKPDEGGRYPCEYGCLGPEADPDKFRYISPGGRSRHYVRAHNYRSADPKTVVRRKTVPRAGGDRLPPNHAFATFEASRSKLNPGQRERLRRMLLYVVTGQWAALLECDPEDLVDTIAELVTSRLAEPYRGLRVDALEAIARPQVMI